MKNESECLKLIKVREKKWVKLYVGLILYCMADGDCTFIMMRYGQWYHVNGTLADITRLIDCKCFYRLCRKHLVNTNYFSELTYTKEEGTFSFGEYGQINCPYDDAMDFINKIESANEDYFLRLLKKEEK
jgi:hypothetical protein